MTNGDNYYLLDDMTKLSKLIGSMVFEVNLQNSSIIFFPLQRSSCIAVRRQLVKYVL